MGECSLRYEKFFLFIQQLLILLQDFVLDNMIFGDYNVVFYFKLYGSWNLYQYFFGEGDFDFYIMFFLFVGVVGFVSQFNYLVGGIFQDVFVQY